MAQIDISIPIQLFLVILSLNAYKPISEEEMTIPILSNGKAIELTILGSANTFKKKNSEKKLGTPKAIPQIIFFNLILLFLLLYLVI